MKISITFKKSRRRKSNIFSKRKTISKFEKKSVFERRRSASNYSRKIQQENIAISLKHAGCSQISAFDFVRKRQSDINPYSSFCINAWNAILYNEHRETLRTSVKGRWINVCFNKYTFR